MSEKFSMSLKFDMSKTREAKFKKYLDQNTKTGINRKESILRLFEMLLDENPIPIKYVNSETPPQQKDISLNSFNDDVDSDDFEGI